MRRLILGVDAGNYNAKTAGPHGLDTYRTAICDWFERDIAERYGDDDMEFEVNRRKGYAGSIAAVEDQFGGLSMFGDSKAHDDTLVRVLLAIYRYQTKYDCGGQPVAIVTGQPIIAHKPTEKSKLQALLLGTHDVKVNGKHRRITIEEVGVAAEGSAAIWSNPTKGLVRIIDVGSGTVNCATISDMRHVNTASSTFNFGMETVDDKHDLATNARGIIRATTALKWRRSDAVYVCGEIASEILPHLRTHYMHVQTVCATPLYANAIGYYEIARRTYV